MKKNIKKIVKNKYSQIASSGCGCDCRCSNEYSDEKISKEIGYTKKQLKIAGNANMGLGCGNPVAFSSIQEGNTVLDLGSGAGIDCFIASRKVGLKGKVIGIDMTEEMIEKARNNAVKQNAKNVKFILAEIEDLPLENNSVDIIISNCVINLTPDKYKTFKEAYRVLKPGGKMFISDIVLLEELTAEQRNDDDLIAGCVGGAILKERYLDIINKAGLNAKVVNVNKEISKKQYQGIALESVMIEATK